MPTSAPELARKLSRLLVEVPDGGSALRAAATALGERFSGASVIYLRSESQRRLVPVAGAHPDSTIGASIAKFATDTRAWKGSALTDALARGETVLSTGTPADVARLATETIRGNVVRHRFNSVLAVPLWAHDEVVAALMVSRHQGQQPLDAADQAALEALGAELAVALDNARLAREVEEERAIHERAQAALRVAGERHGAAFQDAAIGMALFSAGPGPIVVLEVNRALAALLGRTPEAIVALADPTVLVHPDGSLQRARAIERLCSGAVSECSVEQRLLPASGPPRACRLSLSLIRDATGTALYGLAHVHELDARAPVRNALQDPLTGLPNRMLLADRLTVAIARAVRNGGVLAVMCLDVDRLGDVNDMLGRKRGNVLVRGLADRLRLALRANDTLARIDGGEFVVVCADVDGERGAVEIAERLLAAVDAPVIVDTRELHVTASVGIVVTDCRSASPEALVRDADVAMHRAKLRPGTSYELFDRELRKRAIERLELEQDMRRALGRGEFTLHYQPLVSLLERRIVGVEALVRWQHPERGLLSPAAFIPAAEESGLILALGEWVLEEACRQLARWAADPTLAEVYVSVNVSGRQLALPDLPDQVEKILLRTGVPAERLALELTETVLMEETSSPATVLERLQALGVRLLLDDFGTGYSSLNYLKRFPLTAIKVDRSFIAAIAVQESDRHILRAIVSMATGLDVEVIAEGVETLEQATWLASLGCDVAQGFGLARPAPAEVIEPLLRSGLPPERLRWSLEPPLPLQGDGDEPTVPLSDAAQALAISTSTLRRWADTGRIAAVRTAGGHRRFPISELRRLTLEPSARPRARLRNVALPEPPLPALADLLKPAAGTLAAAIRTLYVDEPARVGWFASEVAAPALDQWCEALATACRGADYEAALEATRRLSAQAGYASVSLLERHALVERMGELATRRLHAQGAERATLLDARRLFTRLRQAVLEEPPAA
jgi:diguanylate cyclase (GGDEF)-like protein/excisionase family DNA binding protein/PAS domain S-box-containing protein